MRNFSKAAAVMVLPALIAAGSAFGQPAHDAGKFQPPARVQATQDGTIFVSPNGMTLYAARGECRNDDKPAMTADSANIGLGPMPTVGYRYLKTCTDLWKPYLANADAVPGGDWTIVTRADGGKQWAYRGGSLYFSVRDKRPGDRNGSLGIIDGRAAGRGAGAAGGGRSDGGGAEFSLAAPPFTLPAGLRLVRDADDLVLAGPDGVPLLTPRLQSGRVKVVNNGIEMGIEPEPLRAPSITNLSGFEADFAIINKASEPQFAFRGKPLYRMSPDMDRRDLSDIDDTGAWSRVVYREGEGIPRQIKTHIAIPGEVYTNAAGMTLYLFACPGQGCDVPDGPAADWAALCGVARECSRRWHPYIATADAKPVGDWSIVDVADPVFTDPAGKTYGPELPRFKAWAYRGRPVYTFYQDKEPGDVFGNNTRWINSTPEFQVVLVPGHNLDSGGRF